MNALSASASPASPTASVTIPPNLSTLLFIASAQMSTSDRSAETDACATDEDARVAISVSAFCIFEI